MNAKKLQRRHEGFWYAAIFLAAIMVAFTSQAVSADDGVAANGENNVVLERNHFLIRRSVENGQALLEQQRYAEAKAEADWVLGHDSTNPRALIIRDAAAEALASRTDVEVERQTQDVFVQNRLEMEFRYVQANRLLAEGRYAEAIPALQMAIAIGESIPNSERLLTDSRTLLQKAQDHRNAQMTEEAIKQREQAAQVVRLYEQRQLEREDQRKEALYSDARAYLELKNYDSAQASVGELLRLDPSHTSGQALARRIEAESRDAIQTARAEEKRLSHEREFRRIDEERIPQTQLLKMPENLRPVEPRTRPTETATVDPTIEEIQKALSIPLTVNFDSATLSDTISYLRRATGCNIVIDNRTVRKNDPEISLSVRNTEMVHILNSICRTQRLRWTIKDEAIIISDREITEDAKMEVYDITDLLLEPKDFYSGSFRQMYKGVDPHASDDHSNIMKYDDLATEEQNRRGNEWVNLIRDGIDPWTWSDEGGRGRNTIQYRAGKLVITHDSETHDKIMRLLEAFRRARAVQVSIQARFLTINKDYLERAGIDWTGLDNEVTRGISPSSQNIGTVPTRRAGGSYQGSGRRDEFGVPITDAPWYGVDTVPVRGVEGRGTWPDLHADGSRPSGRLDLRGASHMINSIAIPGAGDAWNAGGLFLDIAFLTRYQLRMIIDAVEKKQMGTILNAPRVTCFNGQRANIVVATLQNYIQTIQDDGTPEIGTVTDGVVFEVKPFVSADHRYVTLELRPSLSEVSWDAPITIIREIARFDPGWGHWLGAAVITNPRVYMRAVETTVSVPDGGTIILGGLTNAGEQEAYTSVPLLARIPVIKYFFMSWAKTDTRDSLTILVTADILVQQELEPVVGILE